VFTRRHWIPPGALIFAQLAHGASWIILGGIAIAGPSWSLDFATVAWIHTVALGWATVAATGVLLHVIPQFTDVRWRGESVARTAVFFFAAGVVFFVAALLLAPGLVPWAAGWIVLALLAYAAAAAATLMLALRGERVERAIARALATTLTFLILTALIGFGLALAISGRAAPPWIAALPAAHASLGMFGWLSLLVFGVSARTLKPIAGDKSRFKAAHIVVGSLTLLGVPLLAVGLAAVPALIWPGATLFGFAAIVYALDVADILRRATVAHRVPQAFVAAAIVWLLCGLVLGAGTLAGKPWQLVFGFVILAGWIGQMIDAHVYHIGVRLLLTIYRGDDDETRPQDVLDARLAWCSFGAFQLALAAIVVGLLRENAASLIAGAALGFAGWLLTIGALAEARAAAMRTPAQRPS
jgi:hypothetical protein